MLRLCFLIFRLLTTLPSGSKSVVPSSKRTLDEFKSDFPCGLEHWKFLASTIVSNPSNVTDNQPHSSKTATPCIKDDIMVLKPLCEPPSPAKVWKWVKLKRVESFLEKSDISGLNNSTQPQTKVETLALKGNSVNCEETDAVVPSETTSEQTHSVTPITKPSSIKGLTDESPHRR